MPSRNCFNRRLSISSHYAWLASTVYPSLRYDISVEGNIFDLVLILVRLRPHCYIPADDSISTIQGRGFENVMSVVARSIVSIS